MSITIMPFLYQTRTLASLPWAISKSKAQSRLLAHTQRFHNSSANLERSSDGPRPPQSPGYRPKNYREERDTKKFDTTSLPRKKTQNKTSEHDIPFEYNRTNRPGRTGRKGVVASRRKVIKDAGFGDAEDGIFEDLESEMFLNEDGEGIDPDEYSGAGSMNLRGPRESTITDSEKRAFQNIFSEMFSRNSSATSSKSNKSVRKAKAITKARLNSILSTALAPTPQTREEKQMVINKWPPALRASIATAIGLADDEEAAVKAFTDGQSEQEPDLNHKELEALREPERLRVEKLLKEAETDFALWAVMEKEVFPLISKLGLEEPTLSKDVKAKEKGESKKERKKRRLKAKLEDGEIIKDKVVEEPGKLKSVITDPDSGREVSALTAYGPLYPAYLLLGIRLLDRSFAKPSPLTLSILPKIKSLGAISHVLGASTQLYNELIRVYFHRYEDFRSISSTLEDMEKSAVEMDEETLEIIVEVLVLRSRIRKGDKGKVAQGIWSTMPHFRGANIQEWKEKIAHGLAARNRSGGTEFLMG